MDDELLGLAKTATGIGTEVRRGGGVSRGGGSVGNFK
jgi:hypothetical protein